MSAILVINSGSSSIKYQLIDTGSESRIATGLVERIGEARGKIVHEQGGNTFTHELVVADHTAGFAAIVNVFSEAGTPLADIELQAVGHRVVQGGNEFFAPTLIDDDVAERILELSSLAPLHNPGHHQAIVAARQIFTDVPHVAVFDTAFHQTMPPEAHTYAIDADLAHRYQVRRYGFHGTSHQVVSRSAAKFAGIALDQSKQIVLHLGNGASACAVLHGRSIDTSMGLTPLQGLVMGTRSGDIDPSLVSFLAAEASMTVDEVTHLLNHESGLLGMAGSNDMRDVHARAQSGDRLAKLAMQVYAHRIRHYLGAYMVALGGLDIVTFTAGVGENSAAIRELVCRNLEAFGIEIDHDANTIPGKGPRQISTESSPVKVLVIPTDEELEIARQVRAVSA